jgi:hypothetical protein
MLISAPTIKDALFVLHPSLDVSADAHSARVERKCEGDIVSFTDSHSLLRRLQLPKGLVQTNHSIDRVCGLILHINREVDAGYTENRFAALVIARYCEIQGIPCVVVVSSQDLDKFFQLSTQILLQKPITDWLISIEQDETMVALWNRAYALMARLQKERMVENAGI